jgi:E1-E2 ATPase
MPAGLTEIEARDRAQRGQSNQVRDVTSRGVADILKSNLLTRFNALLGSLLVVILIVGPLRDAVFGVILVANALIGIAQELRAKYTLDRLAIVAAPQAIAVRDGAPKRVAIGEVVHGDLLQLTAGDEVVVDGKLESNEHIELNEALLTGEAIPVVKTRGDQVRAHDAADATSGALNAPRCRAGPQPPHQAMSSCLTGLCGAAIDAPTPSRWSGQRRRRGNSTRMIRPRDEITDTGGRRQIVGSRGCVQPFDIDGSSKPWRDREFGQRDPSDWTRTDRSSGGGTKLSGGF